MKIFEWDENPEQINKLKIRKKNIPVLYLRIFLYIGQTIKQMGEIRENVFESMLKKDVVEKKFFYFNFVL